MFFFKVNYDETVKGTNGIYSFQLEIINRASYRLTAEETNIVIKWNMKTEKIKLSKTVWFILGTDLITLAARRSTIYCHRKAENVKHIVIKYNASCLQIRPLVFFSTGIFPPSVQLLYLWPSL